MDLTDNVRLLFSMFLLQLPVLLACLAACVVLLVKRSTLAAAFPWAFLGFLLLLSLTVIMPLGQVLIQRWTIDRALPMSQVQTLYGTFALLQAGMHIVAYMFLLVAVLAGRQTTPSSSSPPPLPPG